MGLIEGERTVEIDAPVERCFEIAADIENAPDWQGSLQDVDVLERDADGRAELVETKSDAKVKSVRALLRFSYSEPNEVRWVQEKGDTKSLEGWWKLEDLGGGRTRASYGLAADPGRMLGMLLRGPAEAKVRDFLLGGAADGLKEKAES
jgi:uncharacterized membrane protein